MYLCLGSNSHQAFHLWVTLNYVLNRGRLCVCVCVCVCVWGCWTQFDSPPPPPLHTQTHRHTQTHTQRHTHTHTAWKLPKTAQYLDKVCVQMFRFFLSMRKSRKFGLLMNNNIQTLSHCSKIQYFSTIVHYLCTTILPIIPLLTTFNPWNFI